MFNRKSSTWVGAVAGVLLLGTTPAWAGSYTSLDEAQSAARESGKLLLVDFFATWCGPCKAFDKASKSDADVAAILENYVVFKIDAEKGAGVELAKTHSIHGYPTYVILNHEGETLYRWAGYEKSDFLGRAQATLADPTSIEEKEARFEKEPTARDAAALASYHDSRDEPDVAIDFYRKANDLNQDPDMDYLVPIFYATFQGVRRDAIEFSMLLDAANAVMTSDRASDSDIMTVAQLTTHMATQAGKPETSVQFIKAAVERTADATDPAVVESRKDLLPAYAMLVEKDPNKALGYKRESMPTGWMNDARALNAFAWWCFENKVNLEEARELAEKGVTLADAGGEKAMILDTLAEICNELGNCGDAVETTRAALAESPNNAYYQKQLERFEKLLAEETKE